MTTKKTTKKRCGDNPFEDKLPFIRDSRKTDAEKDTEASNNASDKAGKKNVNDASNKTSKKAGNINDNKASNLTSDNTSKNASIKDSNITSNNAGQDTGKNASVINGNADSNNAVNITSNSAGSLTVKEKNVKATYYFRQDQLNEVDRLSKMTGRDRSELLRMALDTFLAQVQVEK